jgi:glycosyltransferase involved in cell wall biosynthesis
VPKQNSAQNTNELRIALVSSSAPPYSQGGVSSAHYNLFVGLKNRGYSVKLYTFNDKINKSGSEIHRSKASPRIKKLLDLFLSIFFRLFFRERGAYHLSDILGVFFGSLKAGRAIRRDNPDVIILPDHGSPGTFIRKPKGSRFILISHHNPMRFLNNPLIGQSSIHDAKAALVLEQRAVDKADAVICPSHYMKDCFNKTYKYDGNVHVIPNLVAFDLLHGIAPANLHNTLGIDKNSPIVYIPSAGSRVKGSAFVFEIIRRIASDFKKDIGFYLSGVQNAELSYQIKHVPENVKLHYPGPVNYCDNIALMKACSVCVSPTLLENYGMALLEAHLSGLIVIAFDVGGNRDIIQDGVNGYLVDYLDIESMVGCAKDVLGDPKNFNTLSCKNNYDVDKVIGEYAALIENIVTRES